MACFICGRGNCTPSFHSLDEQNAYSDAEAAYEKYLDIRQRCKEDFQNRDEEEPEDDE